MVDRYASPRPSLSSMPLEVLQSILSQIHPSPRKSLDPPYPDLTSLSQTCKQLYKVTQPHIYTHVLIKSYAQSGQGNREIRFTNLLSLVNVLARQQNLAKLVKRVTLRRELREQDEEYCITNSDDRGSSQKLSDSPEIVSAIRKFVKSPNEADEWLDGLSRNEDALVALTLLILPEVRSFGYVDKYDNSEMVWTNRLIQRSRDAQVQCHISEAETSETILPLGKLEEVLVTNGAGADYLTTTSLWKWLGLPSMRRICAHRMLSMDNPEWRANAGIVPSNGGDEDVLNWTPSTSNVSHLELSLCHFNKQTLQAIMSTMECLKTFKYTMGTGDCIECPSDFTWIILVLEKHKDSLQELWLDRAIEMSCFIDPGAPRDLSRAPMLSLKNFSNLINLRIRAMLIFGRTSDETERAGEVNRSNDGSMTLINFLPHPNLAQLRLTFCEEVLRSPRERVTFENSMIVFLETVRDSRVSTPSTAELFPKLRELAIEGECGWKRVEHVRFRKLTRIWKNMADTIPDLKFKALDNSTYTLDKDRDIFEGENRIDDKEQWSYETTLGYEQRHSGGKCRLSRR